MSTLSNKGSLDLVYTDVQNPTPIESIDRYRFYIIFVDYFTKYVWLYLLRIKYDVFIYLKFKVLFEKFFKTSITSIYSNERGEYIKLKGLFASHGITHPTIPHMSSNIMKL